ncbi:MAG TPA: GntR family transcriptional regulator [Candidatus Acidoferrum sp.]|nr:GntR family transcriptional regulator [Candidatus Acidoferrum sp.]
MTAANLVETHPATLKTYLFNELRDAILSGKWKPGERLNESKLARQYNVSRIPVREALLQLQEQGLVMNHPRRGMFVSTLSEEEVQKISALRIVLESEALKLCRWRLNDTVNAQLSRMVELMEGWQGGSQIEAAQLDIEFHRALWANSGNEYIGRTLDSLVLVLFAHRAVMNTSHELLRWHLKHHRQLLDVVQGISARTAEEAMIDHLRDGFPEPEKFSSFAGTSK